jgi:Nucleotidyltransferase of unknown function (DUF6036)
VEQNDIVRFLHAIDEELALRASDGEALDLFLIGRSALILRYGLSLATKDVDLVTRGGVRCSARLPVCAQHSDPATLAL